jgi:lipopolysaccharide/colanic/teichoic acid biosynthesis glycosyltransferase
MPRFVFSPARSITRAPGTLGHRHEPVRRMSATPPASTRPRARTGSHAPRVIDVVGAYLLLVLLAPFLFLIAVLVRATSRGPALFRQSRVGYHEQPFTMLKFRSMYMDSPDDVHRDFVSRMLHGEDPRKIAGDGVYKLEGDSRITPLGRILRTTSLDELPQLINVLRGEMALIGPRPALAWEVELYQPHHHERFNVKPGITGLWQVSGRNRLTMTQALELDVEYARHRSVGLDLWILIRTLPAVIPLGAAR